MLPKHLARSTNQMPGFQLTYVSKTLAHDPALCVTFLRLISQGDTKKMLVWTSTFGSTVHIYYLCQLRREKRCHTDKEKLPNMHICNICYVMYRNV